MTLSHLGLFCSTALSNCEIESAFFKKISSSSHTDATFCQRVQKRNEKKKRSVLPSSSMFHGTISFRSVQLLYYGWLASRQKLPLATPLLGGFVISYYKMSQPLKSSKSRLLGMFKVVFWQVF